MLPILSPILDIINKFVPDSAKQADLRIALESEYTKQAALQASIINKEADSQSWLTRNWRPITMVIFVTMLVLYFIMYTIVPWIIVVFDMNVYTPLDPGLNESLVEVIKLGLGGYIVSRGAETVAKSFKR